MIMLVRFTSDMAKQKALLEMKRLDPQMRLGRERNPVLEWVDTTLTDAQLLSIEGVEDFTGSQLKEIKQ